MNSRQWFTLRDGHTQGPFTARQLQAMAVDGELREDDQVRRGDRSEWVRASQVKGLFSGSQLASNSAIRRDYTPLKRAKPLESSPASPPSPASSSPPGTSIPVGIPVTPAASPPVGVAVSASPPTPEFSVAQPAEEEQPRARFKLALLLVTAGLLTATLILVAVFVLRKPGGSEPVVDAEEAAAANEANEDEPSDVASDVAALESDPAVPADATSDDDTSSEPPSDAKLLTKASLAMQEITKWSVASPTRYLVLRGLARIQVAGAWLEPAEEADDPSSDAAGQHLFVEVKLINNSTDETLGFSSWTGNGKLGDETQAILLTSEGGPLDLATADSRFLAATQQLGPGETIEEVLAFEIPSEVDRDFHLALPRSAVGLPGYFGFEVPLSMARLGTAPATGTVAKAAVQSSDQPSAEGEGEKTSTAGVAAPESDPEKVPVIVVKKTDEEGTRPPSLDEINRQIKEFNEQDGEKKPAESGGEAEQP